MKIKYCRSCKSKSIKKVFNLGKQALTGVFPQNKKEKIDRGNLSMVYCKNCSLLQLGESFNPKKMYGKNYGYMSSQNQSMIDHLKNKLIKLKRLTNLKKGDTVIDIGSNDGTFLNFFDKKLNLIGVDPSAKRLHKYYRKDINLITDFFSFNSLKNYLKSKKAKIITTISMFYDLEDPIQFASDIHKSLDENGIWHLEQSYMPSMIKNVSYDTICHEHLEYYSLKSIKFIFDKVGFVITDLDFNDINGGSFAITVKKRNKKNKKHFHLTSWLLKKEKKNKFNDIQTFYKFYKDVLKHKSDLKRLLVDLKKNNKKVFGYGASTKGNVILQFCGINKKLLPFIADVSSFKYNKYTPGTKIKIISEKKSNSMKPDYYLVLPWHFKDFIIKKEYKYLKNGGKFIFPLPEINIV